VLSDLAELTHWLTRLKLVEGAGDDVAMSETERARGRDMAARLPIRVLSRVWQMLLKGLTEVQGAARPIAAAEMVLVRIAYVADGPGPEELIEQLKSGGAAPRATARPVPSGDSGGPRAQLRSVAAARPETHEPTAAIASSAPAVSIRTFQDVVALVGADRDIRLKHALEAGVRLVHFEPGRIELGLLEGTPNTILTELSEKLSRATGARWLVSLARNAADAAPTLREQAQTHEEMLKDRARADALVKAALAVFPGAEIVEVREPGFPAGDALPPEMPPEDVLEDMEPDE
ncbi:MAG: DNA polymerase III subunit gamma/tau, partial [Parvibaculum sp.]